MPEIRCKSGQHIAITLQGAKKFRGRLVHYGRRNISENFSVGCFVTATMRCPEKDDPNGRFADGGVLRFDPSQEEGLNPLASGLKGLKYNLIPALL
jgi:hypothetical protein